jgi:hypothetical protein
MLLDIVKKGSTDRSVLLRIIDSADGTPETGVVYNSSGIDLWYRREGAAKTSITEATLAALTTAHADGGFLHVGDGYYRLDLPDAAFATGAQYVDVGGTVTGMVVIGGRVRLVDIDWEVANMPANVTQFGGSNLTSASGIPEVKVASIAASAITATSIASDAITAAKVADGTIDAATFAAGAINAAAIASDAITDAKVAADVTIASVTGAVGSVTGAVGSVTGNVGGNVTGSVGSVATGGITAASFAANAITAAKLDPDVTTELQAGLATAAALAVVDGIVDDILLDTAEIGAAGAGLTNINLPNQTMDIVGNITGNLSGSVGSVTGAVGSVTGAVGSVTGLTASDVGAIKAETDKLADTLEDDAGTYRFTTNALEQAPTGGSAPPAAAIRAEIDANSTQLAAIVADTNELQTDWADGGRLDLLLDGASSAGDPWTTTLPGAYGAGTAGKILGDNLNATVGSRATQTSVDTVDDLLDTELAAVKTDTAAIKLKTDNLPSDPADQSAVEAAIIAAQLTAAGVRSAVGLASANLDTQLDALPTNAELTTALGTAADAVLAAIAALNNLSAAQVAAALDTYDAPTKAEFDAAVALLATAANLALVPAAVLTAAAANPIDANVQEINDTSLTGDGNSTPWGPAA